MRDNLQRDKQGTLSMEWDVTHVGTRISWQQDFKTCFGCQVGNCLCQVGNCQWGAQQLAFNQPAAAIYIIIICCSYVKCFF